MLKEGAYFTLDLRDSMKGWNTDYTIKESGDDFIFSIMPSREADSVEIIIPRKIIEVIPPNDLFSTR